MMIISDARRIMSIWLCKCVEMTRAARTVSFHAVDILVAMSYSFRSLKIKKK